MLLISCEWCDSRYLFINYFTFIAKSAFWLSGFSDRWVSITFGFLDLRSKSENKGHLKPLHKKIVEEATFSTKDEI